MLVPTPTSRLFFPLGFSVDYTLHMATAFASGRSIDRRVAECPEDVRTKQISEGIYGEV